MSNRVADQGRLTLTLHWRERGTLQTENLTCTDQSPQELIPALLEQLGLSGVDAGGASVLYRLHRDVEQGPALRSREPLSHQQVADGSRLWLVPELLTAVRGLRRCLLRLPDGTELVVPAAGHGLTRTWLMGFLHLYDPDAYARKVERFAQHRSAYRYVSEKQAHCVIRPSDPEGWVILVERDDVVTERATESGYEPIPAGVPLRLDNGARLRLGGPPGLELGVVIV